ncbi:MAG: DNA-binding protein HU-beta, partial [Gaiellaceae bacterium]|nr:DNA-binding protein HU-beta [Gaiellaceae bacterium]
MTKQEFVDKVAAKSGLTRRDAGKAVEAVLDSITEALKSRQDVSFTGFGKFST